jgi:hypothetical protein
MTNSDPIRIDLGHKGYSTAMALSLDIHIASYLSRGRECLACNRLMFECFFAAIDPKGAIGRRLVPSSLPGRRLASTRFAAAMVSTYASRAFGLKWNSRNAYNLDS